MKLDRYLASAFVYKARLFFLGGGRLWEGGDLERLSLVDDEEPNPRKFFLMSVLYNSEVIVIGGESGLFASRDI
jgi:hypothetical protein